MKSVCFFLAGLFLGGISGVVWMCLCAVAGEADRQNEALKRKPERGTDEILPSKTGR